MEVDGDCDGIHRGISRGLGVFEWKWASRGAVRSMGNLFIHGMGMMLRFRLSRAMYVCCVARLALYSDPYGEWVSGSDQLTIVDRSICAAVC